MENSDLLIVEKLKKYFPLGRGPLRKPTAHVRAVDCVDFVVKKGETLGVVGESGCGKTTLGRCILRLVEPSEGKIYFENMNIMKYHQKALRRLRRDMQIIFQDPYSSLDPRKKAGQIIGEGFATHKILRGKERQEQVKQLMEVVGLLPEHVHRYPHEFSGGQRQRICIARAISLHPKLIIADEPTSSLDVSVQAQILNLLVQLQGQFRLTYIFISHDLSVVRHISDRVAVMYLGRIVEIANSRSLFSQPSHPYTEALIAALPRVNPSIKRGRFYLEGDVPSPINPPPGCSFHLRCRYCQEICSRTAPSLEDINEGHVVACYFPRK
jgi:oligopeptide/dipeptide ABC transporter ATP-binding protein